VALRLQRRARTRSATRSATRRRDPGGVALSVSGPQVAACHREPPPASRTNVS
jgi:hypothetical protein